MPRALRSADPPSGPLHTVQHLSGFSPQSSGEKPTAVRETNCEHETRSLTRLLLRNLAVTSGQRGVTTQVPCGHLSNPVHDQMLSLLADARLPCRLHLDELSSTCMHSAPFQRRYRYQIRLHPISIGITEHEHVDERWPARLRTPPSQRSGPHMGMDPVADATPANRVVSVNFTRAARTWQYDDDSDVRAPDDGSVSYAFLFSVQMCARATRDRFLCYPHTYLPSHALRATRTQERRLSAPDARPLLSLSSTVSRHPRRSAAPRRDAAAIPAEEAVERADRGVSPLPRRGSRDLPARGVGASWPRVRQRGV